MLLNKKGSVHAVIFVVVILVGFVVALGWPQYRKNQTIRNAQQALEFGKKLAFLEASYKEATGFYTPDFTELTRAGGERFPCEYTRENRKLVCAHYSYYLEKGDLLIVRHNTFPNWFEVNINKGSVACLHEESSISGSHVCEQLGKKAFLN